MKILWFSVTQSLYGQNTTTHNGGGWISSLERIVRNISDVQLAVAFIDRSSEGKFKVVTDNVVYYPMTIVRSKKERLIDKFNIDSIDKDILNSCRKVVEDYNPDVIHVFGSEWCFGLISEYTNIPVVIHLQGSWPPYRNAQYPPGYSRKEEIIDRWYNPKAFLQFILDERRSFQRARREEKILSITNYFMGRTRWDKALTKFYSPKSEYFYCSEALRSDIVDSNIKWNLQKRSKYVLVTVGGGHVLKGLDVILKTAQLLKTRGDIDFEWRLLGPTPANIRKFEKKASILCRDVCVKPLGRKSAKEVQQNLIDASLYVHAAYIDNSPNSICEAQYLGLPVISTYVGGIPSLFRDDYPPDYLVPTNDPYYMASKIVEVLKNEALSLSMSKSNLEIATYRHSEECILNDLLRCYKEIAK